MYELSEDFKQVISTFSGDMEFQEQLNKNIEIFTNLYNQDNESHKGETILFKFATPSTEVIAAQDVLFVISPKNFDNLLDVSSQLSERILDSYLKRLGRPIAQFTKNYIKEIRKIVCQNKSEGKNQEVIAGLSGFLVTQAGIEESYAAGFAIAVLVVLISAATSTFCKQTVSELSDALERNFPSTDKNKKALDK